MDTQVKKVAVVIDEWKFAIFQRILKKEGFTFVRTRGITEGTLTLSVRTRRVMRLKEVVEIANTVCHQSKMH